MVGARCCRIATMIRTDDQAVVLTQVFEEQREPSVELLETFRVSLDVVTVTPEHIEIDEVAEDEPLRGDLQRPGYSANPVEILKRYDVLMGSDLKHRIRRGV